jgi:hypothetical protein
MLRLWPADLDHSGHGAASHQAAADGLVLGRASDVDAFQWNVGAAVAGSSRLHFGRAAQRVNDAGELEQEAVAGGLDDAAVMEGNFRIDYLGAQRPRTPKQQKI